MNLFRNYKRYRNLRKKGVSWRVAMKEFAHQRMLISDALFLTLTPTLLLTAGLYMQVYAEAEAKAQSLQALEQTSNNLFQTEALLADVLSGRYIKLEGVHARFGRCNAADGCPQ